MKKLSAEIATGLLKILGSARFGNTIADDATIKLSALSIAIATMLVLHSTSRRQVVRSKRCMLAMVDQDIEDAWTIRKAELKHTPQDTADMLRKIGILKKN